MNEPRTRFSSTRAPGRLRLLGSVPLGLAISLACGAGALAQIPEAELMVDHRLVAAAQRLLATVEGGPSGVERFLGISRRDELLYEFDDPARPDWSYWPRPRLGLSLGEADARQKALIHDFLSTVLSSRGYLQVFHIVYLENVLAATDVAGVPRDVSNYSLAFFGTPSTTKVWGWRFEGHHVSLNFTVTPEGLRPTPSFLGANPETVTSGPLAGLRPLRWERELGLQLLASLSEEQRARAILPGSPPSDLFAGMLGKPPEKWDAWREELVAEGLALDDLTPQPRAALARLIEQIASTYRSEIALPIEQRASSEGLHLAWLGSSDGEAAFYYRLQGPRFLFEFDNGVGDNHVHTVLRDPSGDFGRDLLGLHYSSSHSQQP